MKKLSLAASLLVLSLAAAPEPPELDRAVAATTGMEATFTQFFTPKGFTKPQEESGTVIFGTLPAMRWNYTRQEMKQFIFDGTQSWFYVPSDKQVIVTTITDQHKRDLPFLLLGDPVARGRYFTISEHANGAAIETSLAPKDRKSLIRQVVIATDAATHRINSITYADRDGNRTLFRFSDYKPAQVSAGTFAFTAPAGVQVVRGD